MDAYSKTERHSFEVANEYYRKSERLLRLPCAQPTNLPPSALYLLSRKPELSARQVDLLFGRQAEHSTSCHSEWLRISDKGPY